MKEKLKGTDVVHHAEGDTWDAECAIMDDEEVSAGGQQPTGG